MAGASAGQYASNIGTMTAAGAAIGGPYGAAAGAVVGILASLFGGDGGAAEQQQLARDQLQNSMNQQDYQKSLNALAMQRAIAGSSDTYGSTVKYDPTTNTWVSALGEMPKRIQDAENSSTLLRNAVDIPQATANNVAQSVLASENRRGMSGAVNNMNSYTPTNEAALRGALQDASTRANQATQQPLIQDTLRQFARTGTAAAPVLARMGRESATALSQEMNQNVINSMKGAADIDASRRSALAGPVSSLKAAGSPDMSYAPMTNSNPAQAIATLLASRTGQGATPATQGALAAGYGTQGVNQAYGNLIAAAGNDPTVAKWGSLGRQGGELIDAITRKDSTGTSIWSSLFGGSGNNADQPQRVAYDSWGSTPKTELPSMY